MPILDRTSTGNSAAPARSQRAITPADVDLAEVPRALEVISIAGGTQLVTVGVDDTSNGDADGTTNASLAVTRTVSVGQIIPVAVRQVRSATTATVIGLYGG